MKKANKKTKTKMLFGYWYSCSSLILLHFHLLCVPREGEEWQSVRSLLGKHMLRPKAVEAYDETLNGVVSDLITKLHMSRGSQGLVTDIASEFYRFGLEGKASHSVYHSLFTVGISTSHTHGAMLWCFRHTKHDVTKSFIYYQLPFSKILHIHQSSTEVVNRME